MMEEGDSPLTQGAMALPPQAEKKDPRKVPGGFDPDEVDDLSPAKARSDQNGAEPADANTMKLNRLPSLDLANLPSLPPESSILYAETDRHGLDSDANMDSLDEQAMRRHLMNIESSFLPALSPIASPSSTGVDDTYLFDRVDKASKPAEDKLPDMRTPARHSAVAHLQNDDSSLSQPTPPNAYQTPAPVESSEHDDSSGLDRVGDTTSSLETMSSSPTAAAAARTVSRAISHASMGFRNTQDSTGVDRSPQLSDDEQDFEPTPRKPGHLRDSNGYSSDERSTIRNKASNASLNHLAGTDAGSTPGAALLNRRSSGRRPKFLRSRQASQRSSASSILTNPEFDESAPGADFALQSGGAVPDGALSRDSSYMLSRSISLGSMASGLDDSSSSLDIRRRDRALETLDEEERNRERRSDGSRGRGESPTEPTTPRARTFGMAAPTDTVIARRVQDVQVPETIAREYRTKNRMPSPTRVASGLSGAMGRSGKNLTLKEQSSTIDRLSLENWDLKLRIMFLSDRLGKLSEEGVKEMVSENVDLKTALANFQRDNRDLRRKVKDLEKKLKEEEGRPETARSGTSSGDRSPNWFDQEGAQEREEELVYLRERVEEYVTEIERLRNEGLARESEKRKMAETVRSMGEKRGDNFEAREEMDVWKDLLEQETARREQTDEDNRKLREEMYQLRNATTSSSGHQGLNHTTNIYNITKKGQVSPSRSRSGFSESADDRNGAFSSASTLADELRKESEQLRHENAELRREVGAQTSMLTSRNREKERLYQEIEDLKLQRRGGGSVAGDSILERSISRARDRSRSGSENAKQNRVGEAEREEYENKTADLRDKINDLRLKNQDLQEELDKCMEDFEIAVDQKGQVEAEADQLQADVGSLTEDLQAVVEERDQLLTENRQHEIDFESLRREAQADIDNLELEINQKNEEQEKLQNELADRHEDFTALQSEMRNMSEGVVRLQDDQDAKMRRIQDLEQELDEASRELEEMEKSLLESNNKINRLLVQQESSQGEIAFLREEQDGDKIKIGDLEAALRNLETSLHEEKERTKELEQRLITEREQRDLVAGKEKQEVQIYINELNRETSGAKDEARRLRKSLTSREVEATEWKMRLMELENNLREALGDLNGTRSSLLKVCPPSPPPMHNRNVDANLL
jgi:predicted  nucleic acid-binding Zn-ribbon protein